MGWEFKILGSLEIRRNGETVRVAAAQQRALLAALLIEIDRVVSTDRLIDNLWDADPPRSALTTVHSLVRRLRRTLEGAVRPPRILLWQPPGYRLRMDPAALDLTVFEDLAARGRQAMAAADPHAAAQHLSAALAQWRGPALLDIKANGLRHRVLPALEEAHVSATELWLRAELDLGRREQAIPRLAELVARHPLREEPHRLLMEALRGVGRRAEALTVYQDLRRRLVDELGVEPDAATRHAHRLTLTDAALPDAGTDSPDEWIRPAQLPAGVPDFVGRDVQLRQLSAAVREGRSGVAVVAISGPPGVGKSALALHWAHEAAPGFRDGQLFINLRGVGPDAALTPEVALSRLLRSLGMPADRVPADIEDAAAAYRTMVYGRQLLLVLDNAYDAEQVLALLPGSPGSAVVVTSRRRLPELTVRCGARRITLDPMRRDEATALLHRMIQPDARGASADTHLAELAQLCGYFPLALRLAGARLTELPGQMVAEHVARLALDTERSLLGGAAAHRQSAVRQAFEFSYRALSRPARHAFRLLSLVPGDDLTEGELAVLAEVPGPEAERLLAELATVHLIEERNPGRYRFHDLLRLYARSCCAAEERAPDSKSARIRLLDWYLRRVDAAAHLLYPQMMRLPRANAPPIGRADAFAGNTSAGNTSADNTFASNTSADNTFAGNAFTGNAEALAWLDEGRGNLVSAVRECARTGPHRMAWRLADALRGYFDLRRYLPDFSLVAQSALDAATCCGDDHVMAFAQRNIAHFHYLAGHTGQTIVPLREALAASRRAGWVRAEANNLGAIGVLRLQQGDLPAAAGSLHEAHILSRRLGDPVGEANALDNLGEVYLQWGRLPLATSHFRRALAPYRLAGTDSGTAHALVGLANSLHAQGNHGEAQEHATAALARYRKVGNVTGELRALRTLAAIHADTASLDLARQEAGDALNLARRTNDRAEAATVLITLGAIEFSAGALESADLTYTQALELALGSGARYPEAEACLGRATVRSRLGRASAVEADATRALRIAETNRFHRLAAQARLFLSARSTRG